MMRTVISVPSMGAARILLIPRVIPAPQQRKSDKQAGQRCTATHTHYKFSVCTQPQQPLSMKMGSDACLKTKLMFTSLNK